MRCITLCLLASSHMLVPIVNLLLQGRYVYTHCALYEKRVCISYIASYKHTMYIPCLVLTHYIHALKNILTHYTLAVNNILTHYTLAVSNMLTHHCTTAVNNILTHCPLAVNKLQVKVLAVGQRTHCEGILEPLQITARDTDSNVGVSAPCGTVVALSMYSFWGEEPSYC